MTETVCAIVVRQLEFHHSIIPTHRPGNERTFAFVRTKFFSFYTRLFVRRITNVRSARSWYSQ